MSAKMGGSGWHVITSSRPSALGVIVWGKHKPKWVVVAGM